MRRIRRINYSTKWSNKILRFNWATPISGKSLGSDPDLFMVGVTYIGGFQTMGLAADIFFVRLWLTKDGSPSFTIVDKWGHGKIYCRYLIDSMEGTLNDGEE